VTAGVRKVGAAIYTSVSDAGGGTRMVVPTKWLQSMELPLREWMGSLQAVAGTTGWSVRTMREGGQQFVAVAVTGLPRGTDERKRPAESVSALLDEFAEGDGTYRVPAMIKALSELVENDSRLKTVETELPKVQLSSASHTASNFAAIENGVLEKFLSAAVLSYAGRATFALPPGLPAAARTLASAAGAMPPRLRLHCTWTIDTTDPAARLCFTSVGNASAIQVDPKVREYVRWIRSYVDRGHGARVDAIANDWEIQSWQQLWQAVTEPPRSQSLRGVVQPQYSPARQPPAANPAIGSASTIQLLEDQLHSQIDQRVKQLFSLLPAQEVMPSVWRRAWRVFLVLRPELYVVIALIVLFFARRNLREWLGISGPAPLTRVERQRIEPVEERPEPAPVLPPTTRLQSVDLSEARDLFWLLPENELAAWFRDISRAKGLREDQVSNKQKQLFETAAKGTFSRESRPSLLKGSFEYVYALWLVEQGLADARAVKVTLGFSGYEARPLRALVERVGIDWAEVQGQAVADSRVQAAVVQWWILNRWSSQ
jgi:hypothetical protein